MFDAVARVTRETIEAARGRYYKAQRKAESVRHLIENESYLAAVDELQRGYYEAWLNNANEIERNKYWCMANALRAVQENLNQAIADAEYAKAELENLTKME